MVNLLSINALHDTGMLQVWKIEVPSSLLEGTATSGWALADSEEEARSLSGHENAIIEQRPEHLWISKKRVIWETKAESE